MHPIGRHLTRPWQVVLTGPPNTGKSSLLNAILGYSRAIVDPTAGTTRDVVTAVTALDGWPVEISDTAGIRATNAAVEQAGIRLAEQRIADADLVVLVLDACSGREGVQGSGFRVQGSGFRVQGSGFRVQGSGFRVQDSEPGRVGPVDSRSRVQAADRDPRCSCAVSRTPGPQQTRPAATWRPAASIGAADQCDLLPGDRRTDPRDLPASRPGASPSRGCRPVHAVAGRVVSQDRGRSCERAKIRGFSSGRHPLNVGRLPRPVNSRLGRTRSVREMRPHGRGRPSDGVAVFRRKTLCTSCGFAVGGHCCLGPPPWLVIGLTHALAAGGTAGPAAASDAVTPWPVAQREAPPGPVLLQPAKRDDSTTTVIRPVPPSKAEEAASPAPRPRRRRS